MFSFSGIRLAQKTLDANGIRLQYGNSGVLYIGETGNFVNKTALDASGLATRTYVDTKIDGSGFELASSVNVSGFITGLSISGASVTNLVSMTGLGLIQIVKNANEIRIQSNIDSSGFFNQANIDGSGFSTKAQINSSGFLTGINITGASVTNLVSITGLGAASVMINGNEIRISGDTTTYATNTNLAATGNDLWQNIDNLENNTGNYAQKADINLSGFITGVSVSGDFTYNPISITGLNLTTVTKNANEIRISSSVDSSGFQRANLVITKITNANSPYSILSTDEVILCNANTGNINANFGASASLSGKLYNIKRMDNSVNTIIISGNGTETIDDLSTVQLTTQYQSLNFINNGTGWNII